MVKKVKPLRLLTSLLIVVIIWCGLLPWVARQEIVQQRLQFLDERGIDASAMYYTELEAMEPILDRLENSSVR